MAELIVNLRGAFAERPGTLEWMDDATRAQALAKLDAFHPRTGGPERFIDYGAMRVGRGDILSNMLRTGGREARISATSAVSKWPVPPIAATSPGTASRR